MLFTNTATGGSFWAPDNAIVTTSSTGVITMKYPDTIIPAIAPTAAVYAADGVTIIIPANAGQPAQTIVGANIPCPATIVAYIPPTTAQTATATAHEQYATLIEAGISLTSTGDSSLNGTYACDVGSTAIAGDIMTGIADGLGLPGGGTTFDYLDMSGAPHAFNSTQFSALAKAMRDFVYAADAAVETIAAGGTGVWPSNSVTIA